MIASWRREGKLHLALAAMGPKQILVYNWAAWAAVLQNVILPSLHDGDRFAMGSGLP